MAVVGRRSRPPNRLLALLTLQGSLLTTLVTAQTCQQQLLQAVPSASGVEQWIDAATPAEACTKQLDGFDAQYQLVFSDEFNSGDRDFRAKAQDKVWTAQDLYYFPTNDEEVYKPEQVTVEGDVAVITIEKVAGGKAATSPSQQPDGTVWQVPKEYKSGMINSWNKFCYTGGYVEAAVQLPGNAQTSGFWPAFWLMGNLGRAGYMQSTAGMWPYSYSSCAGSGKQAWSGLDGQLITACPEQPAASMRTAWGLGPQQGRGAPEFDVFEIASTPDGAEPPHASQTLQMAPLMPQGTDWWSGPAAGGVQYPGAGTQYRTRRNPWSGVLGRPGNEYQDSLSALSDLDSRYYTDFHTFGVDWRPGEYLRWYIDGVLLYEVNKQALVEQTNGTGASVGQRLIPLEPMYIIFNLGMSESFGAIQYDKLPFPAQMKIDWVRVYQRRDSINVGCSPAGFQTAEFLACNRQRYLVGDEEQVLIQGKCASGISLSSGALPAAAAAGLRFAAALGSLLGAAVLLLL